MRACEGFTVEQRDRLLRLAVGMRYTLDEDAREMRRLWPDKGTEHERRGKLFSAIAAVSQKLDGLAKELAKEAEILDREKR